MARKTITKTDIIARLNAEIDRYDDAIYRYSGYAGNAETIETFRYWTGHENEARRATERIRELIADIEKW